MYIVKVVACPLSISPGGVRGVDPTLRGEVRGNLSACLNYPLVGLLIIVPICF